MCVCVCVCEPLHCVTVLSWGVCVWMWQCVVLLGLFGCHYHFMCQLLSLCCVLVCVWPMYVCVFADIFMCMCTLLNILILIISVLMITIKLGNFVSFVSGIMDNSVLFIACGLLLAVRFLMPSYRQWIFTHHHLPAIQVLELKVKSYMAILKHPVMFSSVDHIILPVKVFLCFNCVFFFSPLIIQRQKRTCMSLASFHFT